MRYLFNVCVSIFLINCATAPKEYIATNDICYYEDPFFKISKDQLTLNPEIPYQLENKEQDIILIDNKNYKDRYYELSDGKIINKQTNKKTSIDKWIVYRKSGVIFSSEFIYINGGNRILKETYYDEKGNITQKIDYEKGYNICWAEAIEIVKKIAKKDIEKYEIIAFNLSYRVNLNKFPNAKPEWGITLDGNEEYDTKDTQVYWVDGITGKYLRTTKITTTYD